MDVVALATEHHIDVLRLHQLLDLVLVLLLLDVEAHVQGLAAVALALEARARVVAVVVDRIQPEEAVRARILCT